jgi:hypothetical protein
MCYGGVGLVYRGACINEWGGDCLTYCDDGMIILFRLEKSDADVLAHSF